MLNKILIWLEVIIRSFSGFLDEMVYYHFNFDVLNNLAVVREIIS